MNQSALIPISALVTGSTITLADLQQKQKMPAANVWVGLGVVFIAISIVNDLGLPQIGLFAVLVMVTTLITRGGAALAFLGSKANPKAKAGKKNSATAQPQVQVTTTPA